MQLSRRDRVIVGVAIVAAAMLFAWLKFASAPRPPTSEVAAIDRPARNIAPPPPIARDPAPPIAAPTTHVASLRGRVIDAATRSIDVTVAAAANPMFEIALSTGASISGRLTAADGVTSVTGMVGLMDLDKNAGGTMRTGPAGEFTFKALAAGRYRLTGRGTSGTVDRELVIAGTERIEDLVLTLQAGGTVRGTIAGLSAQDLTRVVISVERYGTAGTAFTATPDERGNYSVAGVPGGTLRIVADVSMRRSQARRIEMPAQGDITVDFNFPRGVRLSGRVTRQGKPLAEVMIRPSDSDERDAFIYDVRTSPTGEYVFEDLPDGEYRLLVAGYRAPPVRVVGDTTFDVDVPAALNVSGTVVDASGGDPISSALVVVFAENSQNLARSMRTLTNQSGKFGLGPFQPGDYLVSIYKTDYEMVRERVTVGGSNVDLPVTLRAETGVAIRLLSAEGAPIRDAMLVDMKAGVSLGPLRLNERGESHLPSALAGAWLRVIADGYVSIDIRRWNGSALELRFERPPVR